MSMFPVQPVVVKRGDSCEFGVAMNDSVTGNPRFDVMPLISVSKDGGAFSPSVGVVLPIPEDMRSDVLTDTHYVTLDQSETDAHYVSVRASHKDCCDWFRAIEPIQP